jgi:hypothetical protein
MCTLSVSWWTTLMRWGIFGGGGFLRGRHWAIRTRWVWLPSEKNQPCFGGSREHLGETQSIFMELFIPRSVGNTPDPTSQVFLTQIPKLSP